MEQNKVEVQEVAEIVELTPELLAHAGGGSLAVQFA